MSVSVLAKGPSPVDGDPPRRPYLNWESEATLGGAMAAGREIKVREVIVLLFLSRNLLIFFKIYLFYLLFCAGSSLLAISLVAVSKGYSCCRAQALEHADISS